MECIEARALKSRFLLSSSSMVNSEVIYNDDGGWCLTRINSGVASDDFSVEELLNLEDEVFVHQEDAQGLDKLGVTNISSSSSSSCHSGADELDSSLSVGELSVPVEDLENLEWLSEFVNGSTTASETSLLYPASTAAAATAAVPSVDAVNTSSVNFPLSVPSKARSKRSLKPNGRLLWSLAPADSSSSSSHGSSSIISSLVLISTTSEAFSGVEKPPAKRLKKKTDGDGGSVTGRRCMHCQVQKTPQWRTGPHGPKTLCNACGVRFKSGRLFPEYRPACSPTFLQEVHSNSHRKVLEMRKMKETTTTAVGEESGSEWPVQSV